MKNTFYIPLLMMSIGILINCSDKQSAGGTSIETTNGIAGVVYFDGAIVVNAKVSLIPKDKFDNGLGVEKNSELSPRLVYQTSTNAKGEFEFSENLLINPKQYNLLVRAQDTLSVLEVITCNIECELNLQKNGSLQFEFKNLPLSIGDTLALAGTDLFVVASDTLLSHAYQFNNVPVGEYQNWIVKQANENSTIVLNSDAITITSGSTTLIDGGVVWPYESSLALDSISLTLVQTTLLSQVISSPLKIKSTSVFWEEISISMDSTQTLSDFSSKLCLLDKEGSLINYQIEYNADLANKSVKQFKLDLQNDSSLLSQFNFWVLPKTSDSLSKIQVQYNTQACSDPSSNNDFLWKSWVLHEHFYQKEFKSYEDAIVDSTHYQELSALTIVAKVKPQVGLLGGEIVSLGNHVGMRMDYLDSGVAVYAYSSFAGPSNWHVLSGGITLEKVQSNNGWIAIHMIVDPAAGLYKIYFNGELASEYTSTDTLNEISYDKNGTSWVIAKHALESSGLFLGNIDDVMVYNGALTETDIKLQSHFLLR